MAFRLHVPQNLLDALVAQALAEAPLECCGLLAGLREEGVARVLRRYPLTNNAASERAFLCNDRSLFDAHKDVRVRGLEVLAVYHSHPTSAPVPSRTDVEQNYWGEEVLCVIVSLARRPPEVRCWRLRPDGYGEIDWEATPG